jgi:hypothetical protein
MSGAPPIDWDLLVESERILSGSPDQSLVQQENLIRKVKDLGERTANSIYGEVNKWTPVAQGASTPGSGTYDVQVGHYVRIGHLVWFTMNLEWDDANHTGTGNLEITGLPVAARNYTNARVVIPLINMESGAEWQGAGIIEPDESTISIVQNGTTTIQINGADYTLHATGIYRAI